VLSSGGRLTRRGTLRTAAAAAAAGVGGMVLAACGKSTSAGTSGAGSGAAPSAASGAVKITFQPNTQGNVAYNKTSQTLFQNFVDEKFNSNPAYKGIQAVVQGPWGGASTQIADDIAGTGYTDIWELCCTDIPLVERSGFAQPLNDLLKQDNIPTSYWSAGHILADSLAGTVYGLPSYDGTECITYRQDLLDTLGIPYPDPTWDYNTATRIWTQCTGKTSAGKPRAGVNLYWNGYQENFDWWLRGWGAQEMNAAQDQATMDTTQAASCLAYGAQLLKAGIAINTRGIHLLTSEQCVFAMLHSAYVINAAEELGTQYKWDFLPNPSWPAGKASFTTIDANVMNAATKHPKETWELFKWLNLGAQKGDGTYDYAWPQFQIQINLITPSLVSLWDYWQTTVVSVAPPLKGKALQWWADPSIKGYGYPQLFFRYNYNQAYNIETQWIQEALAGTVSPEVALSQMQQQVNATESLGAAQTTQAASLAKAFPTTGPAMAGMPAGV
jgi:ABC-type glycerol-3-phosphate transport system substrate-binding protein